MLSLLYYNCSNCYLLSEPLKISKFGNKSLFSSISCLILCILCSCNMEFFTVLRSPMSFKTPILFSVCALSIDCLLIFSVLQTYSSRLSWNATFSVDSLLNVPGRSGMIPLSMVLLQDCAICMCASLPHCVSVAYLSLYSQLLLHVLARGWFS